MSVAAVACTTLSAKTGWDGRELLLSYEAMVVLSERSSCSFIADLKPRIPSPIPLPSSGSFFGPNTSKAIPKITNRCVGCKSPSNIETLLGVRRAACKNPCTNSSFLFLNYRQLICRNFHGFGFVDVQVCFQHFAGNAP